MGNCFQLNKNSNNLQNNKKYWNHYGINIPYDIESIPSIDGGNEIRNRGESQTLMCVISFCPPCTLEEYQKKYSITGADGKLYWKQ